MGEDFRLPVLDGWSPAVESSHDPLLAQDLDEAQACDLDLALWGALPDGHVLGGTVHARGGRAGNRVAVELRRPEGSVGDGLPGSLVLRDQEQNPVAVLSALRRERHGGRDLVSGDASGLRQRESGPLPSARLDRPLAPRGGGLLVLARGVVQEDEDALREWARVSPPGPLVLVPEGGSSRSHLPARVAHAVAVRTLHRLGRPDGEVRVAPLHLRDPRSDDALGHRIASLLGGDPSLVLSAGTPGGGASGWEAVLEALDQGDGTPLPGVHPDLRAVLRRWRPPRPARGLVVFLTGLSGSGKSTLARDLDDHLQVSTVRRTTLLDGDVVRRLLSSGLGFDRASREANVRRIGWVAARVAEHGGTAVCSPIAPFASTRAEVRGMVEAVADLVLVHVSTPLEECERRDLKGLYARARAGEIPDFTGISSPYEVPADADVTVDTSVLSRHEALRAVVDHLVDGGWLTEDAR